MNKGNARKNIGVVVFIKHGKSLYRTSLLVATSPFAKGRV
jgi:hypothetical protein